MATVPLVPIAISVSDPVSADVQAVCNMITAVCNLACTVQGQALIAESIKNTNGFMAMVSTAWNNFQRLIGKG